MAVDEGDPTYREAFGSRSQVEGYVRNQYGERTWATLLWELERSVLRSLLDDQSFVPRRDTYCDFACGSGRLLGFVSPFFQSSLGIDISTAMVESARRHVPLARVVQSDVAADTSVDHGPFDLLTAFRFVLNADTEDRVAVLHWMRGQLRDKSSRIILNNHGNRFSHKIIGHAVRGVRGAPGTVTGNVLSHMDLKAMFGAAGLSVDARYGLGHLGGQVMRMTGYDRMMVLQRAISSTGRLAGLGEDQIYVLRAR